MSTPEDRTLTLKLRLIHSKTETADFAKNPQRLHAIAAAAMLKTATALITGPESDWWRGQVRDGKELVSYDWSSVTDMHES